MRILDSDYIELESRRRAQLAAQQWQTVTRISKEEERRAHLAFVLKVYLISLLLFVIAVIQWWFLTRIKSVAKVFIIYNYVIYAAVYIQFLLLFALQYVLRHRKERRKIVKLLYMFILTQSLSMTIIRPTIDSTLKTFLYSCSITIGMTVLSFLAAAIGQHLEFTRSSTHLALWSQKYFLTTTTTIIVTVEFTLIILQISISLILIFFISIFFIIWGRSFASLKFYRQEVKFMEYYIVLHFLNLISIMSNSLIFIERFQFVDDL